MTHDLKITQLKESTRRVLSDCALENGAILAANTDKPYYPREASDYRHVWPRDAAFVCLAGDRLGLDLTEPFLRWLTDKPEDFKKEGLLFSNYATNGRLGTLGKMFEPDQMGTVLWAIHRHYQQDLSRALAFRELIERLANGLVSQWQKMFFKMNAVDIWEEGFRQTSTRMENNHTYSLAACARGLLCADEIIPTKPWQQAAKEMIKQVERAYDDKRGYFLRNHGKVDDANIDASLLGLAWPFDIIPATDPRLLSTVAAIERELVVRGGVHRYQFDYFDSEGTAAEGGGAWPILNFWLAIVLNMQGEQKKAQAAGQWVFDRVGEFIPEQIFDDFRIGISPLSWSHAMFILALDALEEKQ